MSLIKITDVTKSYGNVQVIQKFSETFKDREFITLLGPSGCGKTTILRMLAGFEKPNTGEIKIDDVVVNGKNEFVPPNERKIGMVFQSYAVWPHMNVFENVAYPLKIQGVSKKEIRERVNEILDSVHLSQYLNRMPNELSGGQQQRVALGRALVSKPKVLLLDEPLSNLDAKLRETMRFEIKDLQKKFGITVVYVTHDQNEAMAMSDRIIVLNRGVVQQVDSPINIYKNPVNQFVADFVGKINFIKGNAFENKIEFSEGQFMNYNGDKRGKIVLSIRPENMRISSEKGILHGKILHYYYLGDVKDFRIDINGVILRVILSGSANIEKTVGDEVFLDFDDYLVFEDDENDSTKILT